MIAQHTLFSQPLQIVSVTFARHASGQPELCVVKVLSFLGQKLEHLLLFVQDDDDID